MESHYLPKSIEPIITSNALYHKTPVLCFELCETFESTSIHTYSYMVIYFGHVNKKFTICILKNQCNWIKKYMERFIFSIELRCRAPPAPIHFYPIKKMNGGTQNE